MIDLLESVGGTFTMTPRTMNSDPTEPSLVASHPTSKGDSP